MILYLIFDRGKPVWLCRVPGRRLKIRTNNMPTEIIVEKLWSFTLANAKRFFICYSYPCPIMGRCRNWNNHIAPFIQVIFFSNLKMYLDCCVFLQFFCVSFPSPQTADRRDPTHDNKSLFSSMSRGERHAPLDTCTDFCRTQVRFSPSVYFHL